MAYGLTHDDPLHDAPPSLHSGQPLHLLSMPNFLLKNKSTSTNPEAILSKAVNTFFV
jgi:hypothetical protein